MGLDMYLRKGKLLKKIGNQIELLDGELVVQWRKANAIHAYFEKVLECELENCQEYEVTTDLLKDLLTVIDQVQANHSLAPSLLPTIQGFFFGGTDYDDWYFEDLAFTKIELTKALTEFDENREFLTYHAWW